MNNTKQKTNPFGLVSVLAVPNCLDAYLKTLTMEYPI